MLLKIPAVLLGATGIGIPHCNMYCSNPTVLRHTDLPPALGPDIKRIRFLLDSLMSSGTTDFPFFFNDFSSNGCMAMLQSISGFVEISGCMDFVLIANFAFARVKSISAKNSKFCSISCTSGRILFVISSNIRCISRLSSASNSLILLFASTTSDGSM